MLTMKYYIATLDHGSNCLFYLSKDDIGHFHSDISEAISFNSFEDALEYMLHSTCTQFIDCGCSIAHIADCTIEKAKIDKELMRKLHDPCYVL